MRHDGALSIYANDELLLELGAEGTVTAGPQFHADENAKLVFRTLAMKYPRWVGDLVAAFVRGLPVAVSSRVAVASAAGGPVASDLSTRIYRAVLEEVALRAEENGQEAEAREAERQREQYRKDQDDKEVAALAAEPSPVVLDSQANGSLSADQPTSA